MDDQQHADKMRIDEWRGSRYLMPRRGKGFYESWFLRANHPSRPQAIWVRYTIFEPRGGDAEGELWGCFFDGETSETVPITMTVPMADCSFDKNRLDVSIGESTLVPEMAKGGCVSEGMALSWDLTLSGGQPVLLPLPEKLYGQSFPKAKLVVNKPNALFNGTFTVNGKPIALEAWRGSLNHNWGTRHTDEYCWGQVAGFDNAPNAFLEVASAKVRVGPIKTPRMTPIVLRLEGRQYRLNGLLKTVKNKSAVHEDVWSFSGQDERVRIRGEIRAQPDMFATFSYRNPPGGLKTCLNTKIAACDLWVSRRGGKEVHLHSQSGAAWEILSDSK